jgi:hypothetical protein
MESIMVGNSRNAASKHENASIQITLTRDEVIQGLSEGDLDLQADSLAEYRTDRDAVMAAVGANGYALEYADGFLKADKEVVLKAVCESGEALEYANDSLKANPDIVAAAVSEGFRSFEYAHETIRGDREFVRNLICELDSPNLFRFATTALKSDKDLVLEVLRLNPFLINYVSSNLCSDPEVLMVSYGEYKVENSDDGESLEQFVDILKNNYNIEDMEPGDVRKEVGKGLVDIYCIATILTDDVDIEIMFYLINFQVQSILLKLERCKDEEWPYTQRYYFRDEDRNTELSDNGYFSEFMQDLRHTSEGDGED